jgi:hypothetical protein
MLYIIILNVCIKNEYPFLIPFRLSNLLHFYIETNIIILSELLLQIIIRN